MHRKLRSVIALSFIVLLVLSASYHSSLGIINRSYDSELFSSNFYTKCYCPSDSPLYLDLPFFFLPSCYCPPGYGCPPGCTPQGAEFCSGKPRCLGCSLAASPELPAFPGVFEPSPPLSEDEPETAPPPTVPENPTVEFGDHVLAVTPLLNSGVFNGHPVVSLIVRKPGQEAFITLPAVLVDTGASTTALPIQVGEIIGYEMDLLEKVAVDAAGATVYAYAGAKIEIGFIQMGSNREDIEGYILGVGEEPLVIEIPVLFLPCEEDVPDFLLGRKGVLGKITLSFESEDMVKIEVKKD